jgi:hypothetical protein
MTHAEESQNEIFVERKGQAAKRKKTACQEIRKEVK